MRKAIIFFCFTFFLLAQHVDEEIKVSYTRSYTFESVGNYREAIKVLSPLYTKYPQGYVLNLRFAWLFYLDKKYSDAKKYYQKASVIKPDALDPKLGLVRVLLATFSFEEAEQKSYEILKKDHYNYYANLYVTQALNAQKKYDEAVIIVQKMLALYPTDIAYLELLAVIYKETNHSYLHALYENILILDPNNTFVKNNM